MKPTTAKKSRKPAKLSPSRRARATVRKGKAVAKAIVRDTILAAERAVVTGALAVRYAKRKAVEKWGKVEAFAAKIERGIVLASEIARWARLAWDNRHIILAGVAGIRFATGRR